MTEEEIEKLVTKAVIETLFQLGLAVDDPRSIEEARKDLAHLRRWRKAVDEVGLKSIITGVGVLITGIMAAIALAFNNALHVGHN